MKKLFFPPIAILVLSLSLTSCDEPPTSNRFCRAHVGCTSRVTVEFVGQLPEACIIQVSSPQWQQPQIFHCSDMMPAGSEVRLNIREAVPDEVSVFVIDGRQVVARETFTPEYIVGQPNGPNCSPICYWATMTMVL